MISSTNSERGPRPQGVNSPTLQTWFMLCLMVCWENKYSDKEYWSNDISPWSSAVFSHIITNDQNTSVRILLYVGPHLWRDPDKRTSNAETVYVSFAQIENMFDRYRFAIDATRRTLCLLSVRRPLLIGWALSIRNSQWSLLLTWVNFNPSTDK